jgi:hypothetical protein
MPVSATTVAQYYQGIFRQAPSAAVSAGYQAMATDAAALNSMLSAANIQVDPVVRLYQTAFNRLPDTAGMTAWVVPYSTNAITLQAIANGFTQSTEFTTLYPTSMSNAQYVGALYWNILQRAGEDAGIKGWTNALNSGALTRAQVLLGFSESGEFVAKVEPNVNTFLSKIANTPVADQGKASLYTGSLFDQGGVVPGDTFTLTTNIETVPASGTLPTNAAVVGVVNTAGSTFQTGDTINGAVNGNNILTITDAGALGANVVATVNNVTAVRHNLLASNSYDASLFNGVSNHYAVNAAAAAALTITNGQIATAFGARESAANSFTVNVGIRAADTIGTTTTLKLDVNNAGSTVAPPGADATVNTATINSTSTGIETISIATAGTNVLAITGTAAAGVASDNSKVVVTGAGANTINVSALTQALTYDLSGATGNNTLRFNQALQSNTTITGGSGTDTVRVDQNSVVAGLSLSNVEILRSATGGSTGTLAFTASSLTTLRVDGDTAEGGRLSLIAPGAIATMDYRGDGLSAQAANVQQFKAVTITGAYSGSSDAVALNLTNSSINQLAGYTLNAGGAAGAAILANGIETLTINAKDVGAAATTTFNNGIASATLQSVAVTTAGGVNLGVVDAAPTTGNSALTSIDLSGVTGTAASAVSFDGVESVGAATQVRGPAGTSALTITTGVQGATDTLIITGGGGNTTIDAQTAGAGRAAFAGTLTFTSAAAGVTNNLNVGDLDNAAVTNSTTVATFSGAGATNNITGGVGVDTITITATGLGSVNVVNGAAGADVISASGSSIGIRMTGGIDTDQDRLTGGSGADQFRFGTTTLGNDIITNFTAGTDLIGFLDGAGGAPAVNFANTTGTAAGAVFNAADISSVTANDGTGLASATVGISTVAMTTAQIEAIDDAAGGTAATTAYLVVFNSTTGRGEIWYDADWAAVGNTLRVATLDNVTTLVGVTALTNANFVAYV